MTNRQQWAAVAGVVDVVSAMGVPKSFVIDREGLIVKKVIGASPWDAEVNQILIRRLLESQ